ncbi:MAG TPA: hypothetical protein VES20_11415 [Bryobacteraceae bacterium]|nr:hypothetical protein [Bryobacteraceae bacterium]
MWWPWKKKKEQKHYHVDWEGRTVVDTRALLASPDVQATLARMEELGFFRPEPIRRHTQKP